MISSSILESSSKAIATEVKIKPEDAQRAAYKAAKSARSTLVYWKNANVKYIGTTLYSCAPNFARPINELSSTDDKNRKPFEYKKPVYEIEFRDQHETCSSLFIYVDANTGKVIAGFYTSD